jgi:Putative peptidoglycan binding domain
VPREFMRRKLLASMAVLAIGIWAASCEKSTNEEPAAKQSESAQAQQPPSGQTARQSRQEGQQEQAPQVAQTQGQPTPQDRTSAPQSTASQPAQNQEAASASPSRQSEKTTGSAAGPPLNLTPDQVRQAQMLLKQKGFDPGDIDGVLGRRTGRALITFQRQQGLQPTGQIDQRTATALGLSTTAGSTGRTGTSGPQ